jgi:serine acetyltransferase
MRSRAAIAFQLPLLWALRWCSFTETAQADALRFIHIDPKQRRVIVEPRNDLETARFLLRALRQPGVRSVFYHRLSGGRTRDKLLGMLLKPLYRGGPGIEIVCDDIGPGFLLGHGQSVVIWAKRIGANCTVYQNCTIGLSDATDDSLPVLGQRVWLWPASAVIGVEIGDDATIGAGAVVLQPVPAGRTAVGVPARII